jgi:TPR repeat protein
VASLEEAIALYDKQEFEKAYDIFVERSYKRDPEALFYLGLMYFFGEGVEKDEEKCLEYWKKAMREGHQEAAYRLSELRTSTKTTF